ncbi:MAG: hypothetical protein LBQ39_00555, partial [Tannerellaceae bacterium]|nr:hypothetical protein [Tannerellaceae bacterium]
KDQTNFRLTSVHFYNRNTVGCIAPAAANGDWTGHSPQATDPSLPTDPKPALTANSIPVSSYPANNIIADFYAFETAAGLGYGASAYYDKEPCLIIGGKYRASDDSRELETIPETYYRIDFYANYHYLALLRNHRYTVTVNKVAGPGYLNKADVLKASCVNVEAELEWTDDDLLDVMYDGRDYLAVSSNTIKIPDMDILVETDCEGGWVISEKSGDFYLSRESGAKGEKLAITATALYANETRDVGYFYIAAGRFKKKIIVRQTEQDISFEEATPVNGNGVIRTDQKVSMMFEGSYDGTVKVRASCVPEGIVGTGVGSNNTTINFKLTGPTNPFERRIVTYLYSIKGVDDIPVNDVEHYLTPEYGIFDITFKTANVTPLNISHKPIKNYFAAPSGWHYITLNATVAKYFNDFATSGGKTLSEDAIPFGIPDITTDGNKYLALGGDTQIMSGWKNQDGGNQWLFLESSYIRGGTFYPSTKWIIFESPGHKPQVRFNLVVERN